MALPLHFRRAPSAKAASRAKVVLHAETLETRDLPSTILPDYVVLPDSGVGEQISPPPGYSPAQVRTAYGFNNIAFGNAKTPGDGAGTTIAIVDAYNDPNIQSDVDVFDKQFGLIALGQTLYQQYGAASSFLTVVNQSGGGSLPRNNVGWASEISLDVEWAHAIAPGAKILLVEARSDIGTNLYQAAAFAASQPGVNVVSMSWGQPEFSGENGATGYDGLYFAGAPGVTFVNAAGDTGAPPDYPGTSPNVLAVGGTSLKLHTDSTIASETGWGNDTGSSSGGISAYEPQPGYQSNLVISVGNQKISANGMRTNPDVAYDADPDTGFAVYDSYVSSPNTNPWQEFGGTSAGTPQWAALIAIADQGRALVGLGSLTGATQTLPMLYEMPVGDFNDITSGMSLGTPNYTAGAGYDLVTGLGSPVANKIVAAFVDVSFTVTAPATATAGGAFTLTVQATDAFNNPATAYSGTVQFSSTDSTATLPANATLTNGMGTFSATLTAAGTQTITVTDTSNSSDTGTSNPVSVSPAQVTHFRVATPGKDTRAIAFDFTVTAEDAYGNPVPNFTGTVDFSSTDSDATLPPDSMLTSGTGTFSATLTTTGSQTLTAVDSAPSTITGVSGTIAVSSTGTHLVVITPTATTAGNPFVFGVLAEDQFNNIATSYTGTVQFTSSDSQAALPADATLTSGMGYFPVDLLTAGIQSLTATDIANGSIAAATSTIAVAAAAASHFAVTPALLPSYAQMSSAYPTTPAAPTSFANAGSSISFTVAALDPYGNVAPSYAGTIAFTSSDTANGVVLPSDSTLSSGVGTFNATLQTPGSQTITATDAGNSDFTGTSNNIITRGLVVTGFQPTSNGFAINFNQPVNPGTVNLYTTGNLPDDVLLTRSGTVVSIHGSLVFNNSDTGFTFVTTNTVSANGSFNAANGLLAAGTYTVTLRSYNGTNGFQDAIGGALDGMDSGNAGANFKITFTMSAPPVAVAIPDFARGPSNTDALFFSPDLADGSTFDLSYTNPITSSTGTATVTFSTNAGTLQTNIQNALTSGGLAPEVGIAGGNANAVVIVTNDTSSGANVLVTFQNALASATSQVLTSDTPGVSIGVSTIDVANNIPGSGIPISLSSGLNVTSGSFTLQYDPELLNISGVVASAAVDSIPGATFTLISNTSSGSSGTAVFSLFSPAPIAATTGSITLGSLVGNVPLSAIADYGAKELLHFSGEQLNDGDIPVTNEDSVQVVAYFGDVSGTGGPFTLQDAIAIARVSTGIASTSAQTLPGFAAFPNLDPTIIGDVSLQGRVTVTDAGVMNQEVGGTPKVTIPYAPIGLTIGSPGPFPAVSGQHAAATSPAAAVQLPGDQLLARATPQDQKKAVPVEHRVFQTLEEDAAEVFERPAHSDSPLTSAYQSLDYAAWLNGNGQPPAVKRLAALDAYFALEEANATADPIRLAFARVFASGNFTKRRPASTMV